MQGRCETSCFAILRLALTLLYLAAPTLQVDHQHRQIGRGDAADPARLGQIDRAAPGQASPGPRPADAAPLDNRSRPGCAGRPAAAAGRCRSAAGRCSRRTWRRRSLAGRPPAATPAKLGQPAPRSPPRSTSGRRSSLASDSPLRSGCVSRSCADPGDLRLLRLQAAASAAASTRPSRWPSGVSRRSALSGRSSRRYSARLVNMRYGSSTPRVTRSSIITPM